MKAKIKAVFEKENVLQTSLYNGDLHELGLKYIGNCARILLEMVGCGNVYTGHIN